MHAGPKLARQRGGGEGDQHSEHVQHLLEAQWRGLKTGNHNVLLHAAHAVHAEREDEEDETQVAVGLRADLLVVVHELENWG